MNFHNDNLTRFYSDGSIPNSYKNINLNLSESYAERKLIEALNQIGKNENKYGSTNDMRFQQKQQQEREQRRIEMTSSTKLSMDETQTLGSSFGRGKVRQMFEQRRGVDKSYPLKPISNTSTTTTKRSTSGGAAIPTSISTKKQINSTNMRNSLAHNRLAATVTNITFDKNAKNNRIASNGNNNNNLSNGNGDNNKLVSKKPSINNNIKVDSFDSNNELFGEENSDNLDGEYILDNDSMDRDSDILGSKISSNLPNFGKLSLEDNKIDESNNNMIHDIVKKGSSNIKLKPVITRKTPTIVNQVSLGDGDQIKTPKELPSQIKPLNPAVPMKNTVSPNLKSVNKAEPNVVHATSPPAGMVSCKICRRNFNEDRIGKHQEICQKSMSKKRKTFDTAVHRVRGTDAEKYIKKPSPKARAGPIKSVSRTPALSDQGNSKKSNWRKKHEEFIEAIRAAKQVQEHLAKGGKLSDLPPPPPSDNSDYIQCPHCSRKFNEAAASRHIPKCATMLHNKPKPNAPPKKRY